eukprot:m.99850 g.99850  ORF g.99850 m.99850 type:complete len:491 (-) comp13685_c0_seq2:1158-2630(-)
MVGLTLQPPPSSPCNSRRPARVAEEQDRLYTPRRGGVLHRSQILWGSTSSQRPEKMHQRLKKQKEYFVSKNRHNVARAVTSMKKGTPSWIWSIFESAFYMIVDVFRRFTLGITLPLVRLYLETIGRLYARTWNRLWYPVNVDGYHPKDGIFIKHQISYGTGQDECTDMVVPVVEGIPQMAEGPVVVYVHGGGFVACNSEVLLQSLPFPLARNGFRVFSLDYPLAPEDPFPSAVLSTMRALRWIKARTGVKEVVLIGDSAGGCIVSVVAGFLCNPTLLRELSLQASENIANWDMPTISHMVSCYGVLDRYGWTDRPDPKTGERHPMAWNDHIGEVVLEFCVTCYLGQAKDRLDARHFLSDFTVEELHNYPPSLILCGKSDPLIHGARSSASKLKAAGVKTTLLEYPGHHGFMGFPIQWTLGRWKMNTLPGYIEMFKFITGGNEPIIAPEWPRDLGFDFSMLVILIICLLLLPIYSVMLGFKFMFRSKKKSS